MPVYEYIPVLSVHRVLSFELFTLKQIFDSSKKLSPSKSGNWTWKTSVSSSKKKVGFDA